MAYTFHFTSDEIVNILVSVVAISLALTLVYSGGVTKLVNSGPETFIALFAISAFSIGIGFVLHESMHKYFAIKYGAWAQFQASPVGLLIGVLLALFLPFTFLSPGAVYIYSAGITRKQNGIISVVGPLTNIALCLLFVTISLFAGGFAWIFALGAATNAWLALFNMLPFGPLDGTKVLAWDWRIWGAVTLAAFLLVGFIVF